MSNGHAEFKVFNTSRKQMSVSDVFRRRYEVKGTEMVVVRKKEGSRVRCVSVSYLRVCGVGDCGQVVVPFLFAHALSLDILYHNIRRKKAINYSSRNTRLCINHSGVSIPDSSGRDSVKSSSNIHAL